MKYNIILLLITFFIPTSAFALFDVEVNDLNCFYKQAVGDTCNLTTKSIIGVHTFSLRRISNEGGSFLENGKEATPFNRPLLYGGKLKKRRRTQNSNRKIAASYYEGVLSIDFFSHSNEPTRIDIDVSKKNGKLRRMPPSFLEGGCGVKSKRPSTRSNKQRSGRAFSPQYRIEIGIDADYEFFQDRGSSVSKAHAAIETIMNTVNQIYSDQIGVWFKIKAQNVFSTASDPYSGVVASELLSQMVNYAFDNRHINGDVLHLFSGKNIEEEGNASLLGLARGGICGFGKPLSITEGLKKRGGLVAIIVAHEIGHNLSASHVSQGIMKSFLTPDLTSFSSESISQITAYVEANNSCMDRVNPSGGGNNNTAELTLKVKKRKKKISFKQTAKADLSACEVNLYIAKKKSIFTKNIAKAKLLKTYLGVTLDETKSDQITYSKRPRKKVFFASRVTCGDDVTFSKIRGYFPKKGKAVSPKKFIKKVDGLFG